MKYLNKIGTLVIATLPVLGNAATVTNGSFENHTAVQSQGVSGFGAGQSFDQLPVSGASWGIWTSGIPGWSTDANGVEIQTQRTSGLAPSDGSYYAELDTYRNSRIYQNIYLLAGEYALSFDYAPSVWQRNTNAIWFGVAGLLNTHVNGPNVTYPKRVWTNVSHQFTVENSGTYKLYFKATGDSDAYGGLIDNIDVSVVPLPGALALLGSGLFGLGMMRRRRSKGE